MTTNVVCIKCVGNKGIKNFIEKEGMVGMCTYCGLETSCACIKHVIDHIEKCITYRKYTAWSNGSFNIKDILLKEGFNGKVGFHTDVINQIDGSFSLRRDVDIENSPIEVQPAIHNWSEFQKIIREKNRFFSNTHLEQYNVLGEGYYPAGILNKILDIIRDNDLVDNICANGRKMYRARSFFEPMVYDHKNLGVPPIEVASSTRMTPYGIPAFYASFDKITSVDEIRTDARRFVVGLWEASCELKVVSLGNKEVLQNNL